jgi:hypothetical protein
MSSNTEALTFYLEANSKAEIEKMVADTIASKEKKYISYEIQDIDKKRSIEYTVMIKDEKTATGATIDEAVKNAKVADSKMTLKAAIKYAFSKEEIELIKRKEKPSSASPFEDIISFTEARY